MGSKSGHPMDRSPEDLPSLRIFFFGFDCVATLLSSTNMNHNNEGSNHTIDAESDWQYVLQLRRCANCGKQDSQTML